MSGDNVFIMDGVTARVSVARKGPSLARNEAMGGARRNSLTARVYADVDTPRLGVARSRFEKDGMVPHLCHIAAVGWAELGRGGGERVVWCGLRGLG